MDEQKERGKAGKNKINNPIFKGNNL